MAHPLFRFGTKRDGIKHLLKIATARVVIWQHIAPPISKKPPNVAEAILPDALAAAGRRECWEAVFPHRRASNHLSKKCRKLSCSAFWTVSHRLHAFGSISFSMAAWTVARRSFGSSASNSQH